MGEEGRVNEFKICLELGLTTGNNILSLPHSKEEPLGAECRGMLGVDEEAGLFHLISKWE